MDVRSIVWSLVGGIIGGSAGGAALFGVLKDRWLERVRANYAGELEAFKDSLNQGQKHMQARIDRSIFVSRAQFDSEFSAMKQIFGMLTEVRLSMELMRPRHYVRPENQTAEDRMMDLLIKVNATVTAFNLFSTQIDSLSPFYPEALYKCLLDCRQIASEEITDVQVSGEIAFKREWYAFGDKSRSQLTVAYHEAAKLIRDRLDRLSVVS